MKPNAMGTAARLTGESRAIKHTTATTASPEASLPWRHEVADHDRIRATGVPRVLQESEWRSEQGEPEKIELKRPSCR